MPPTIALLIGACIYASWLHKHDLFDYTPVAPHAPVEDGLSRTHSHIAGSFERGRKATLFSTLTTA